ncbi:tetratricopeptide repeat protein [Pontibacter sp. Tf4]|uniref:tetratricopeptide repeat-containing sensor histidine kinase n=1 Tax=Pontibacter sp. Tf4 TaxID=2761620 RepID=UPI001629EBB2|nr:tetratricopeptide repeat protein [Pontibacter sp. Tf4]MBB6612480.1 tetratricopeptide repeat protein [Pontibacter sp. Tf4]
MIAALLIQFILLLIVPPRAAEPTPLTGPSRAALHHKVEELCELSKNYWYTDPKKAVAYGKEAVEEATKLQDSALLALAYNNAGAGFYNLGDYNTATEYYYKSLRLREVLADTIGLSTSYNNIGNIYISQFNYSKALSYYNKAMRLAEKVNDTLSMSRALNNMGNVYERQHKYHTALHYYLRALPLKEKTNDSRGTTISLVNIGYTYQKLGKYTRALHYLQRGLALTIRTNNLNNQVYAYRGLAETYQGLKNYPKAILYARTSLELAQKTNSKAEAKESADVLHKIFSSTGDYKQAYDYLQLSSAYTDSINSEEITRQTTSYQVKYETARKEKENLQLLAEHELHKKEIEHKTLIQYATIVLLAMALVLTVIVYRGNRRIKRMNKALSRKNKKVSRYSQSIKRQKNELATQALALHQQKEELEKLNKLKDKLFSVVAHDIKGPLQSLKSLLDMLAMGRVPEEKFAYFTELLASQQQSTLWLVDNLLLWTRSQMQGTNVKLQPVNLHALTEENITLLSPQAQRKGISLHNMAHSKAIVLADTEMIKLVLRNLLSNAIKFCSQGDEVTIETELLDGNELQVTVRDTGIGISAENQARLFGLRTYTTLGTAREKGSGLGLALCKDFIESNGGSIWVESAPGEGCTFKFTLPALVRQPNEVQAVQLEAETA